LFPLLRLIPSYITNSSQLVSILDKIKLPDHYQFIIADVDNLYPSIDIDDALATLYVFLKERSGFTKARIKLIINLTRWVLKNNYVTFGDKTFLQIKGTAMGTPCAVVVACIYMHMLEQEALRRFKSTCYVTSSIYMFNRFIDDYLMAVSDYDTGIFFMKILNSIRENIKITFRIRNSEAEFLDLTLYKTGPNTMSVKSYIKPMNKHLFLPPTSCHPPHRFSGWITGYGRRLRGQNEADHHFKNFIDLFESSLVKRGYKQQKITNSFAVIPDRQTIIESIRNNTTSKKNLDLGTPFVITYTPAMQATLNAIKEAIAITEEVKLDPHYPMIFSTTNKILISYKCGKNLRDLVAPSTL
jgi:hypothetical protein